LGVPDLQVAATTDDADIFINTGNLHLKRR
jgi:hypothetical protein